MIPSTELALPTKPIKLTRQQELNIQILAYGQAIKDELYTPDVIYKLWPTDESLRERAGLRPSITGIQQYMATEAYRTEMFNRGIEVDPDSGGLTGDQVALLSVLTDLSDRRSFTSKLRAAGVTSAVYRGWMRQKPFNDALRKLSSKTLEESIPVAEVALAEKAANGDLASIKFAMEVTGRHNPAQQQAIDAQQLLAVIIDVAQEVMAGNPSQMREFVEKVKFRANGVRGML